MRVLVVLVLAITAVTAAPKTQRIVGGTATTIDNYPEMVALLLDRGTSGHQHNCGGTILNNRSVLTAAHCTYGDAPAQWQSRVGSTYANNGGLVYATSEIINYPSYVVTAFDDDIGIIRIVGSFIYSDTIRPGTFTGPNYNLADHEVVWATGWGSTSFGGFFAEQLRHVQIWTVNQNTCRNRYADVWTTITEKMLCAGWLDVGGRDQCTGDSGGPLYHNGNVVGVCSFGASCGDGRFPGVNTRVSSYVEWLQVNA